MRCNSNFGIKNNVNQSNTNQNKPSFGQKFPIEDVFCFMTGSLLNNMEKQLSMAKKLTAKSELSYGDSVMVRSALREKYPQLALYADNFRNRIDMFLDDYHFSIKKEASDNFIKKEVQNYGNHVVDVNLDEIALKNLGFQTFNFN